MRPTILVIEEDPDLARLFQEVLHIVGYTVLLEADLGPARQVLVNSRPDAVVYDWSIARAAGYLWVDEIRSSPEYGGVPVLLVCDAQPPRGIRDLLVELCVPVIEKPFDINVFCRILDSVLPLQQREIGGIKIA